MIFLTVFFTIFMVIIFIWCLAAIPRIKENYKNYPAMTLRKDTYPGPPDHPPLVSILVPARNEEKNIGNCLNSLINQDYPNMEIIAIDDNSTDKTGEIIEDFQRRDKRVKLLKGQELPPGWMGKSFALYQGVCQVRGEYLLFIDADERFSPQCLTQTICYAREHSSDLLVLVPRSEAKSFWEKVVLPVISQITWVTVSFSLLNDPYSNANLGGGPYLLFRREVYEKIGGHEKIKGEITEDIALVNTIKQQRFRLNYLFGRELLTIRAYTNLKEIWRQLSKSFFLGIGRRLRVVGNSLFLLFSILILPWLSVPLSIAYLLIYKWGWVPFFIFILGLAQCAVGLFTRALLKKYVGIDNTYSFLQPLGALIIAGIIINSTVKTTLGKGVAWKGRTYS